MNYRFSSTGKPFAVPSGMFFNSEYRDARAGGRAEGVDFPSENERLRSGVAPPKETVVVTVGWFKRDLIEHLLDVGSHSDPMAPKSKEDGDQLVDQLGSLLKCVIEGLFCCSFGCRVHDRSNLGRRFFQADHWEVGEIVSSVGGGRISIYLLNVAIVLPLVPVLQVRVADLIVPPDLAVGERMEAFERKPEVVGQGWFTCFPERGKGITPVLLLEAFPQKVEDLFVLP